ncbi:MAG: hypothetical protein KGJ89_03760 [Patescibacteria group bacterium]|nr:hypothetical protein [Patescibacteria group bacterium]MDE2015240.1 hypothetical protein [Patescibacteria group bacterium]MDE2227046.1 hypothetical protein [Patescibacteria group bacterium]
MEQHSTGSLESVHPQKNISEKDLEVNTPQELLQLNIRMFDASKKCSEQAENEVVAALQNEGISAKPSANPLERSFYWELNFPQEFTQEQLEQLIGKFGITSSYDFQSATTMAGRKEQTEAPSPKAILECLMPYITSRLGHKKLEEAYPGLFEAARMNREKVLKSREDVVQWNRITKQFFIEHPEYKGFSLTKYAWDGESID